MENDFPKDLKYSKDYVWLKKENDVVVLGVVKPGVEQVEEFVFVMLPEKEKQLQKGDVCISLEAVKWSGEITTPVSGKVVDVNMDVFNNPSLLNKDPYKNWLIKIAITDEKELTQLMNANEALLYYQEKLNA